MVIRWCSFIVVQCDTFHLFSWIESASMYTTPNYVIGSPSREAVRLCGWGAIGGAVGPLFVLCIQLKLYFKRLKVRREDNATTFREISCVDLCHGSLFVFSLLMTRGGWLFL